ncbi:MAG: DUF721 domain-containing protein [Proteobacteria bacterium]|nr:DUF721 domain-containing protein [Pseudomonadota bacterium]
MPKKTTRNKHGRSSSGSAYRARTGPVPGAPRVHSVKDLLARAVPVVARVNEQAALHARWESWLRERLPAELAVRICGVAVRQGTLVVFADSAAWGARLRFALAPLEAELTAAESTLTRIEARVLPGS